MGFASVAANRLPAIIGVTAPPSLPAAGRPTSTQPHALHDSSVLQRPTLQHRTLPPNAANEFRRTGSPLDPEFPDLATAPSQRDRPKENARAEEEKFWVDFEKDVNIRGNFMVIQVADLYRKDHQQGNKTDAQSNWVGRPNFKQFSKVCCLDQGP